MTSAAYLTEIIGKSPIINYSPSQYGEIPLPDLNLFTDPELMLPFLAGLEEYLTLPTIYDKFNGRLCRDAVIKIADKKYPGFAKAYDENAIRWNHLYAIDLAADNILTYYSGLHVEELKDIANTLREKLPKDQYAYKSKGKNEKEVIVNEIKALVYDLLFFLSMENTAQD